jgi:hypothetical protein
MKHLGMSAEARTYWYWIASGAYWLWSIFEQILVLFLFTNTPIHDAGWYGVLLLLFLLIYCTYFLD